VSALTPYLQGLKQGRWYRFRAKAQASAAMADSFRVRIQNVTRSVNVESNGKTWSASSTFIFGQPAVGSFTAFESHFRIPSTFASTDIIRPDFSGFWTGTQSLYYDASSIFGPALRPGYSTW